MRLAFLYNRGLRLYNSIISAYQQVNAGVGCATEIYLKIGDIIYSGTPSGVGKLNIGDNLKGFIEEKELLNFNVL